MNPHYLKKLELLSYYVLSGFIIGVKSLFHPLRDHELYRDKFFWHLPDPEEEDATGLTITDTTARAPLYHIHPQIRAAYCACLIVCEVVYH